MYRFVTIIITIIIIIIISIIIIIIPITVTATRARSSGGLRGAGNSSPQVLQECDKPGEEQ